MLTNRGPPHSHDGSALSGAIDWLGLILGLIFAFWMAPVLYGYTVDAVIQISNEHYGPEYQDYIRFAWMCLLWPLVMLSVRIGFTLLVKLLSTRIF